ncbi:hypothetical protein B0H12DRAFT_1083243 [Mycena haematopus]|nr:hypothetical protein B0H12DRAFT_1083243 [Mycena haematopus]
MNSDHLSPNSRNCVLDATDALRRRIDLLPVGAVAYGAHNRADGFDNRLRIINTPVDAVPDVAAARRRRIDLLPVGAVIDGTRVEGATNHLPNDEAEVDLSFLPDTFVTRECYDLHRGDVVHRDISMAELVPEYIASRPSGVDDEPDLDFQALHSRYYTRSAARLWANRLASSSLEHEDPPTVSTRKRTAAVSFPELPKPKRKRHRATQSNRVPNPKWLDENRELRQVKSTWSIADAAACINSGPNKDLINTGAQVTEGFAAYQKNDRPDTEDGVPSLTNDLIRSTAHSHAKPSAGCKTRRGNRRPDHKIKKTLERSDLVLSENFSILSDASVSSTELQGAQPPRPVRAQIVELFHRQENGAALHDHLSHFFLVPYRVMPSIDLERATFFVDRDGHTFMYRSYRALWLMARAHEVEHAHNVLVGSDLQKATERAKYHKAVRGPHMALIFGHHKQSAVKPYLTKWHTLNQDRVDEFMNLKIVKDIIGFVTDIVTTVFPGVAARFKTDADWHFEHYGIRPLFGLFWNLCLNAWFPGQRRIQCAPHADFKNQIGVCVLLIYVLECGVGFNDTQRTWIVIWEADVIVQLPPWTIAIYPSALFFHFNIDVHQIQFVTTEGNILPTRENVRPVEEGDDIGRGSFVFFNQSTMRHGPETGFDTLKMAAASGHSVTGDYGSSAQEAFSKHGVFCPLPRAP